MARDDTGRPLGMHRRFWQIWPWPRHEGSDSFGRMTEVLARAMGTPWFLLVLTIFSIAWIAWNTLAPARLRFDSAANGFTALTLVLSLQASYSSPLILLAQNRQADRDRVQAEQDRMAAGRNMNDTEYLAREVAALKLMISELPTQDEVRTQLQEIRTQLDALLPAGAEPSTGSGANRVGAGRSTSRHTDDA
jgi:uncharacterized membrane protein